MNILLINHYAGSPSMGMEFRPYYMARKWNEKGHNTTIIAADNSHIRKVNPDISSDFEEQTVNGVKYVWVKTRPYEGNGLARFLNMLDFVRKLNKKAKLLVEKYKPDVVIASSTYPLDNYVAKKISKLSRAKYIYEVHDLWPLSPKELGGMSKYHPFIMIMQAAENFAYKHCDAVVSMLPKTKEYMNQHGLDEKKWHYVPNGICIEDLPKDNTLPDTHKEILSNLKAQGKIITGYAGTLGVANAVDYLIKTAKRINNDRVHFVITGIGPEEKNLKEAAKGLTNVTFLPPVPKTQVQALLSYHDILYIGLKNEPLFRFGISPNKVFDYMYAAKPIIMAIKAGNDLVGEAGCGITVEPENPEAIIKAINKLIAMSETEREVLGQNGRKFVLENHTYDKLASKFLEIMKKQ